MREGAIPCAYTADLGRYDRRDRQGAPGRSFAYGAELSMLVDCQRGPGQENLVAMSCGAFHIRSGGRAYFNTTPLGGPSPAPCSCARCTRTASTSGATARPSRGNDIERFYRYGLIANPGCGSTSRGSTSTSSASSAGRAEMSWLTEPGLPYRDSPEKAYSTDANIWGATHEARPSRHLDVSLETVEPIMGVRFWDPECRSRPRT